MFWTVLTSIFAWLPLVRILGRPEGYTWRIWNVGGAGTDGPYWIFIASTVYVVAMLYTGYRGPRALFYPLLILWHLAVTGVVLAGVVSGGTEATLQGQGLHFEIPLWVLALPFIVFAALAVWWVSLDWRQAGEAAAPWARGNSVRLAAALGLLIVALALFRAGTNYNWVTAAAIVVTILHWMALVQSFAWRQES